MKNNLPKLKNRIVIIEGMDCTGKTMLAKKLAYFYDQLTYMDTDFYNPPVIGKCKDDATFYDGINLAYMQVFKSIGGLVKARYSLSENVYSYIYGRESIIDPRTMEKPFLDKIILILLDVNYKTYIERTQRDRPDEVAKNSKEHFEERRLFKEAFNRSNFRNKIILLNDETPDILLDRACNFIDLAIGD